MNLLKCKLEKQKIICERFYMILLKTSPFQFNSLLMANVAFAYFTIWTSFSYATACSQNFQLNLSQNKYNDCTMLLWFNPYFSLSTHWFVSVVSKHHVVTILHLESCIWNSNLMRQFNIISTHTEKNKFSRSQVQDTLDHDKPLPLKSFVLHRNLRAV